MSHYHFRNGTNTHVLRAPLLNVVMGYFFLCFAMRSFAQLPPPTSAQLPPPTSAPSQNSENLILIPDRGNVSVLKLDDQLRVGKPISDNKALTFTFSDSIEGIVDREMKLKGRAQIRRNDTVLKADEIIYHPDTDIADLIGNVEIIKGNSTFRGPKANLKVDARQGEMQEPT